MEKNLNEKVTVTYTTAQSKDQINWGGNDDPAAEGLKVGETYEVADIEMRSFHTKLHLKDFPGKKFNSVGFSYDPPDAWERVKALYHQGKSTYYG